MTTLALLLGLAQAAQAVCRGDCGSDGAVSVDELLVGVNIALGTAVIDQCKAMDASGEGEVTVDELVGAVRNALTGCPMGGHPIVYAGPGEGTLFNDIWVVGADGSGKTDLTNSPDNFDTDPAWSRDGSRIAWSRGSMGSYQIAVMNADGSNQHVITDEEGSDDDEQPAWSPDGQQIVFVDRSGSLVIVQADGSGRHFLLHGSLDISHNQPNWSPDGSKIAFASNRDNPTLHNQDGFELYTVRPDGSDLTRLTNNTAADNYPVWSPDGGSILFLGQRSFKMNVLRINANGSGEHPVTNSFIGVDAPAWSRDGSLIVYTGFGSSPLNYGLLAANADGSGEHLVLPAGPSVPDIY